MKDYIYDHTFEGLLTCIYEHYYSEKEEKAVSICGEDDYLPNLVSKPKKIVTDPEKAGKVYDAILNKISQRALSKVYHAYLSICPQKEMHILKYVQKGFRVGVDIDCYLSDEQVMLMEKWNKRVGYEKHKFLGYVRFSQVGDVQGKGVLVSKIKPDNDILPLLADHFCDRYKGESFIIYDEGREKALIGNEGRWYIREEIAKEEALYRLLKSELKDPFHALWKAYFETIAIKERENPRCQMNFVPKKYRENLVEF